MSTTTKKLQGWKAVFGCTYRSLAVYRIALGCLLTLELALRFRYLHPFYSDAGTLPLNLLLPKVDLIYQWVCVHCYFGNVWQQQVLLSVQVLVAVLFTFGYQPRLMAFLSWFFYFSLTLRNTWLNYILDRYFHYLLLHAIFLPTGGRHQGGKSNPNNNTGTKQSEQTSEWVLSPATISIKLLLFWIYLDAGGGKLMDPMKGWTWDAQPLPALDTYTRHTTMARYVYALLGPPGLRFLTPVVVWVELLAVPCSMLGCYFGLSWITYLSIILICALHVGIAACMSNAALLSFVACVPWSVFLPTQSTASLGNVRMFWNWQNVLAILCLGSVALGSIWMDAFSATCHQSVRHIWTTLLHNRWNVFMGAEEYVTWEIAPGLLADGVTVVDVWARKEHVTWAMPGAGAPSTSTARPGRWRSFPYLAELEGEDGEALWGYLCKEWNRENPHPNRQLIRYNFYMLQADVLPNMAFSATRKRLIHQHECNNSTIEAGSDNSERQDREQEALRAKDDEL
ncbi:hypothetical protein ACA910_000996 [Epithemia clementina (nom. ined.)]